MSVAPQLIEGGRDSTRTSEPTSENSSCEYFIDGRNSEKPKTAKFGQSGFCEVRSESR